MGAPRSFNILAVLVVVGSPGRPIIGVKARTAIITRAEELAAYVGLTPSQYSSADKIRMGRITRAGKSGLRGTLVEASWRLITKDMAMREKYDRIKSRAGGKRAIVAIARMLLLRLRRILLDGRPYVLELAG